MLRCELVREDHRPGSAQAPAGGASGDKEGPWPWEGGGWPEVWSQKSRGEGGGRRQLWGWAAGATFMEGVASMAGLTSMEGVTSIKG